MACRLLTHEPHAALKRMGSRRDTDGDLSQPDY
jgi:hypothetical protein